jgi:hypothetical protein
MQWRACVLLPYESATVADHLGLPYRDRQGTKAFEAPASLSFDFSPMRKAIDEMAERQRRMFENIDRMIKQGLPGQPA